MKRYSLKMVYRIARKSERKTGNDGTFLGLLNAQ